MTQQCERVAQGQKSYTLLVVLVAGRCSGRCCGKDEMGKRTTNDARPKTGSGEHALICGNR